MNFPAKLLALVVVVLLFGCSDVTIQSSHVPSVTVESFQQVPEVDGIDIVWLVDRSCSMLTEDDVIAIAYGVDAMMEALPLDVGWRLSITSTDSESTLNDDFFPLLPGDDANDALDMLDMVDPRGGEEGFSALQVYMEDMPGRYSQDDWMRRDAALLVVMVSDEDEQSPFLPVPEFANWFRSQRDLAHYVAVTVPDLSTCTQSQGYQTGDRYIEAAGLLQGTVVDYCGSGWDVAVADVATTALEPIERYELKKDPIESTLEIVVNHVQWGGLWEYAPDTNEVLFIDVPPPGAFVAIGYIAVGE